MFYLFFSQKLSVGNVEHVQQQLNVVDHSSQYSRVSHIRNCFLN